MCGHTCGCRSRPGLGAKLLVEGAPYAGKDFKTEAVAEVKARERRHQALTEDFLALLTLSGVKVVKYHRNGKKGAAERVVVYDTDKKTLCWDSSRCFFLKMKRSVNIPDVLDVERHGRCVFIKTMHSGELCLEMAHAAEAEVFFGVLDGLLDEHRGQRKAPSFNTLRTAPIMT